MDLLERDMRLVSRVYKTMELYFEGKNIQTLEKDEVVKYCKEVIFDKDLALNTGKSYLRFVNQVLKEQKNPYMILSSDFEFKPVIDGLLTKKEVDTYVNLLENPQDQLILYGIFYGLCGRQAVELRYLQNSQVDLKKQTITLDDRIIKMDREFTEVVASAIEQHSYYVMNISEDCKVSEINFEMSCPFVLKQRPMKSNDYGMSAFGYEGFRSRIKKIALYLDAPHLKVETLLKSGYAYKIHTEMKKEITYTNINQFAKENGMKVNASNLMNTYKALYEVR